uniref:t-SNARE coiled-coil homology domain-containing protein n=1 Tax=Amorphochlora amoebiformis TaxID=1561963 RepID=A0A7S0GM38_9EUKA
MSSPGTLRRKGSQTKFAKAAGAIMHGIQSVSVKLERMTKLAKKKSLFEDPSRNIQELRFVVKEEITRLSDDIQALQNFQKQGDTFGGRHSRDHSTAIVKDLQIKLADTTKNFQGILALRTKNLQAQASRRKRYGDARHLSLRKREVNSFGKLGPEGKTHSQLMIQEQQRSKANEEYLMSRAETVQDIERMLNELGGIYEKVLNMVQAQGEVALNIHDNLVETKENMDSGVLELQKLYESVSSNRWLILKVFFVLILFAIFFTVFVA